MLHLKDLVDKHFPVHAITRLPTEGTMVDTLWIPASERFISTFEKSMTPDFEVDGVSFSYNALVSMPEIVREIPDSVRSVCETRIDLHNESIVLSAKTSLLVEKIKQVWKLFYLIRQALLQSETISDEKFLQDVVQVCAMAKCEMHDISSTMLSFEASLDETPAKDFDVLRMYNLTFESLTIDSPGSYISYNLLVSRVAKRSIQQAKAHMMHYAEELENNIFSLISIVGDIDIRSRRIMQQKLEEAHKLVRTILCIPASLDEKLKVDVRKCLLQEYDCTHNL